MKFKYFLLTAFLIAGYSSAQWEHLTNGISGNAAAYSVIKQNDKVFASTQSQLIYVSTDYGANWAFTQYLASRPALSLGSNNKRVFAGSDSDGVYISSNGGSSWFKSSLNEIIPFYSFGVNEVNVFAGTANNGVFASYDNGLSWLQTSLNNVTVRSIAVSGNTVFAGTNGNGVYISADNGSTWTQSSLNNIYVHTIAISGNNVYATDYSASGVYWSPDNGNTWTNIGLSGYNNKPVLLYDDNLNNYIIVGTGGHGFFISDNNGATWVQKNEGFTPGNVNSMCFHGDYIFAGTAGSGIYRRFIPDMLGVKTVSSEVPESFALYQNYPNPFNPVTKIKFEISNTKLEANSKTEIRIYDMLGREVTTLVDEKLSPGTYEVEFDGSNYPSGVYYYTLSSGSFSQTRKLILLK